MNVHTAHGWVHILPTRPEEMVVFSWARAEHGFARFEFFMSHGPLTAAECRIARDLFETLASRMDAIERAQAEVSGARASAPIGDSAAVRSGDDAGAGHQNDGCGAVHLNKGGEA